ncbi:MAG: hypothetical protein ABSF22_10375 [Bryobacteraceae bacterium]
MRVLLLLAVACAAYAQDLAALRQTAEKTSAQWEALAKGLEPRIARLLPCDPTSRAAVEEVSHASDARLAALSAYVKAEAAQAKNNTDAAKGVLAAQAALGGGWNAERVEADQQRADIETQVSDLKESMRKRGSLAGAEQVLIELANMVKERAAKAEEQGSRKDLINTLLGDLVVASQVRQTALENQVASLEVETARWISYYTARLSRSVTECAIINAGAVNKKKP